MHSSLLGLLLAAAAAPAFGCDGCYGPRDVHAYVRKVFPRIQPDSVNALASPGRGELAWGQVNFLHTTDTHGKQKNSTLVLLTTLDYNLRRHRFS